jgi:hypothetical protein
LNSKRKINLMALCMESMTTNVIYSCGFDGGSEQCCNSEWGRISWRGKATNFIADVPVLTIVPCNPLAKRNPLLCASLFWAEPNIKLSAALLLQSDLSSRAQILSLFSRPCFKVGQVMLWYSVVNLFIMRLIIKYASLNIILEGIHNLNPRQFKCNKSNSWASTGLHL